MPAALARLSALRVTQPAGKAEYLREENRVLEEALRAATGKKRILLTNEQSPNCSPHAERFVRTIRSECLDPFVIFGERHLRYLNDNELTGTITCRSRLGGLLNFYGREAA